MVNDRVGDFIIRLQNAAMIGKEEVRTPHSIFLTTIAKKLKDLGFLRKVEVEGEIKKTLIVELSYDTHGNSKLRGVKRMSKPGRRLYGSHAVAHRVKEVRGLVLFLRQSVFCQMLRHVRIALVVKTFSKFGNSICHDLQKNQ